MTVDVTPILRLHARRRAAALARQDAVATQAAQLLRLVRAARNTRFGVEHGFAAIDGVEAFQRRVPLRRYDEFWTRFWQAGFPRLVDTTWPGRVPYFAVTSGTTTGASKYIPVTQAMNRANRRAALDLLTHHLANRPRSRVMEGRSFMLGGSTALEALAPGVRSGDLSGIAAQEVPRWARPWYFPPREEALIADWEEKIARLAPMSLEADIRSLSGTPSWLLLFFDRLAALLPGRPRRIASWYPRLELLAHGGVDFAPYRRQFDQLLEGSGAELREVYPASEGFIAIADHGPGEGMRLIVDGGLFYELVPVEEIAAAEPVRHWLGTAEPGVNYALVLSTCAGLWGYVLGDTVRFVELEPPRILVSGRISYSLSAFGEHLIAEEIEHAIATAATAIDAAVVDYSVGAVHPEEQGARGRHRYFVEFAGAVPEEVRLGRFAEVLDRELTTGNDDYRARRAQGFGMDPPEIRALRPGTFALWMKSRGQLGGQHKVPRIINDAALLDALRAFVETS